MLWGKKPDPVATIYTEETCNSCGHRTRRTFEEGDHVYKQGKVCQKCAAATTVSAVYGEYPPEKTKA